MNYNFHTHTYRCGHATGAEKDYIEQAISGGIKYMGFSEHAPFRFPDGYQSPHRVQMECVEDYFQVLSDLREAYKDKVDIKIGFEMEYYPKYFEEMLDIALAVGCEYLILGHHFLYNEHPDGISAGRRTTNAEDLDEYVSCVIAAIKSGYFTYVAHPDIINFVGDPQLYEESMRKICAASREYHVPLEINFLGIREGRSYPNAAFWKIAGEEKSPVTFGMDAHRAEHAFDGESLKKAKELVARFELNYIGMPELVYIQEK